MPSAASRLLTQPGCSSFALPIGVLLLLPGIYMIVKSGAHANIEGPADTSARTRRSPFDELTF